MRKAAYMAAFLAIPPEGFEPSICELEVRCLSPVWPRGLLVGGWDLVVAKIATYEFLCRSF